MPISYDYFLLGILGILLIFAVWIWLDKIIRLIIWNYLVSTMCLSVWNGINILIDYLNKNPASMLNQIPSIQEYLIKWKPYLNLALYFIILILLLSRSRIWYNIQNKIMRFIFTILLAPLAVFSLIVSLCITVIWSKFLDYDYMMQFASTYQASPWLYKFLILTPLWIIIPWIVLILFSLDIKLPNLSGMKKQVHHIEEDEE